MSTDAAFEALQTATTAARDEFLLAILRSEWEGAEPA